MSEYDGFEFERLPKGWKVLAADRRWTFAAELANELSDGHELYGKTLTPVATCERCNEILVFVEDMTRWALVHLTWKRSEEVPPLPISAVVDARMPRTAMTEHSDDTVDAD